MLKLLYIVVIAYGSISMIVLSFSATPKEVSEKLYTLEVSFLDVGQGDATYIRLPDGIDVLVDGGPDNSVLTQLANVMPWHDRYIDYLVMTHADRDHFAGLLGVIETLGVGSVLYNGRTDTDPLFKEMKLMLTDRHIPLVTVEQGRAFQWPSGVRISVVWPVQGHAPDDDNANSVVLDVSWQDEHYLITGDAGLEEEELMVATGSLPQIDVLKVGHHGSRSSSGDDFLEAIKPRYCIVSAGRDNSYGHPHQDVVERLIEKGCEILETSKESTITFESTPEGTSLQPRKGLRMEVIWGILLAKILNN